jgi:hypothetical protein
MTWFLVAVIEAVVIAVLGLICLYQHIRMNGGL